MGLLALGLGFWYLGKFCVFHPLRCPLNEGRDDSCVVLFISIQLQEVVLKFHLQKCSSIKWNRSASHLRKSTIKLYLFHFLLCLHLWIYRTWRFHLLSGLITGTQRYPYLPITIIVALPFIFLWQRTWLGICLSCLCNCQGNCHSSSQKVFKCKPCRDVGYSLNVYLKNKALEWEVWLLDIWLLSGLMKIRNFKEISQRSI